MAHFDVLIKNGTVATAADVFRADIGIVGNKIVQLGIDLGSGTEEIDATGRYVMPGGIDSHVHISQPSGDGIIMADNFESGTLSALFGGNTTIMPFCLPEADVGMRQALTDYHELAQGNCYTDVAFHMIVSDASAHAVGQELPALIRDGYTSLKVFMTYDGLRLDDGAILAVMDLARREGARVMIHCENEDAIKFLIARHEANGDFAPKSHASSRPIVVEREATHRAVSLAEVAGVSVVIVHVSNGPAINEIVAARTRGHGVVAETCPQYLMLTADDLDGMDWEGAKFVCSPPPRDKQSQIDCWTGIEQGVFDLFSSDHCPFRFDDPQGKLNPKGRTNFRHIPNGIPGVELRLPILFSEGVKKGRIDLPRFVALTSTNHAKTYGLMSKGGVAIGMDADLAIWDPDRRYTVRHADLHDGSDYTPYENLTLTGMPVTVLLRGQVMMRDRQLIGSKGQGTHLSRTPQPSASETDPK